VPLVPMVTVEGVGANYVLAGGDFPLFANASIVTENQGPVQVTLTITLLNPAAGLLIDPNAATDGSTDTSGLFSVTGASDVVTKVLQGLIFQSTGGTTAFAMNFSGGVSASYSGTISGTGSLADSYSGAGVVLWSDDYPSNAITLANSTYFADDFINSPSQSYAHLTLDAASAVITTPAILTLVNETLNQSITLNGVRASSASGDNGVFFLHDSNLAVNGHDDNVAAFESDVSFTGNGAANTLDLGSGFDDVIVEQGVSLTFQGVLDTFYFESNDDALTLQGTQSDWSTLYATGGVVNLQDAMLEIVGGGVIINQLSVPAGEADDDAVTISQTNGVFDTVDGKDLTVGLDASQAAITGGGETIGATAGSTVALVGTSGNWDAFYGSSDVIGLNGAQAVISGGGNTIYAAPDLTTVLTGTGSQWDGFFGSDDVIGVAGGAQVVIGGDYNTIGADPGASIILTGMIYSTDVVIATDDQISLDGKLAVISGGGNSIIGGTGEIFVIQDTAGRADAVTTSFSDVALSSAEASIVGDDNNVAFSGTNTLSVQGAINNFYFAPAMGLTTIAGFGMGDVINLSASDWSRFAALQASHDLQQSGANTLITLDAADTITLLNVNASTLTSAQFNFA
jgi:hypothetical protein